MDTPFPPPQLPRKIDLEIESGEYFLTQEQKASKVEAEKESKKQAAVGEKKRKREEAYQPPKVALSIFISSCYLLKQPPICS